MSFLLDPAIALMQRLRLLPKFILVCIVFLWPLMAVSALLTAELNRSIAATSAAQSGAEAIGELDRLAVLVSRQRGIEHLRLSTRTGGKPAPLGAAIAAGLAALEQRALPVLAIRPEWRAAREQWAALAARQATADARASMAAHTALLGTLRKLARALADDTGLSLDPVMASNFLIDASVNTLPELADALSLIAARGAAYIDTGLLEAHEDQLINAALMAARHGLERAPARFEAMSGAAPGLAQALAGHRRAVGAGLAFLERTTREVSNSHDQGTGASYLAAGDAAAANLHALGAAAAGELERMLDARRAGDSARRNAVLAGIALALGLAAWLFIAFYVSFARDIARLNDAVQRAAGGDLAVRLESHASDEIGDLVNAFGRMNAALLGLVTDIRAGATTIGTTTHALAEGNAELAEHTDTQAGALARTVGSMGTLAATIKRSAGHASAGRALVGQASAAAERGVRAVGEVVDTMASIHASSRQIGEITGVIDALAFQTNILALNAAVEAARAGDQGRGFAVVAAEVRNLAQRSSAAAREIRELIVSSGTIVAAGNARVDAAGATIGELVAAVGQVELIIGQMDEAGRMQATEIAHLETALERIDAMTKNNGKLVDAAHRGSARLHQETRALANAVGAFTVECAHS